ncbi:MAG: type II secretion system F family protein [Candidatus Uhrbacteria bacterium]
MRFSYIARTEDGQRVRGVIDAADSSEAIATLQKRQLFAVELSGRGVADLSAALSALFRRPRSSDIVVFLRQCSVMVNAKVTLVRALRSLVYQTTNSTLRSIVVDLVREVESGRRFSEALGAHPRVFSAFAIQMIRAGETSGKLDEVLNYLADQAERDQELKSRTRGAMVYPAFILGGIGVVAFIMMTFVVPRLTGVLQETGATLPITTRLLIAVSSFLAVWWWAIALAVVIAFVAFRISLRSPSVRVAWDRLKLRLPIAGSIGQSIAVVRFTRSFGLLLRGDVDVVPALEVVRDVVGNMAYAQLLDDTIREVRDGSTIASVLARSPIIPSMVAQLIAVGEETGRVEEVLDKLAKFYDREVEQSIRNLITIIEPLVMIILGVAVGIMVAAVIMPMYNLASQF